MVELAVAQAQVFGIRAVVYSRGGFREELQHHGIVVRRLPAKRLLPRALAFSYRCVQDLRELRPLILHVHGRPEVAWLARRAGLRTPIVLSCDYYLEPLHAVGAVRPIVKGAWRAALRCADVIAPVSQYCLSMWEAYWGLPRARLSVLPNGVNLEQFRPSPGEAAAWRRRLAVGNSLMMLYVGRVCSQKGVDLLPGALRLVRQEFPDAVLVVAGPPERFGRTGSNSVIAELAAAGARYVPPVDDAELPGLYSACDVFVMPTRNFEMFGMAAVEAQACGRPVVASDHGGLTETVPASAGLRFRVGDSRDLGEKILLLLKRPDLRRELGEGALRNAAQYEWGRIAQTSGSIYANVMGSERWEEARSR